MISAACGENVVSHTTCKKSIKNFAKEISVLKMNGVLNALKTDELQPLLDINSAQTEKELVEELGVTQQAISARLHMMRKVQKEGR